MTQGLIACNCHFQFSLWPLPHKHISSPHLELLQFFLKLVHLEPELFLLLKHSPQALLSVVGLVTVWLLRDIDEGVTHNTLGDNDSDIRDALHT